MSDAPYDYSRERWDAEEAANISTRLVAGVRYDVDDLPDRDEL